MDFERKNKKIREKQRVSKRWFFWSHFWMDFEVVWGGFWEAFGRDLGGFGGSWVVFWRHFWSGNYTLKVENQFHRKKEVPREDLEGFRDDFGQLLGEVWSLLVHLGLIFGCLYDACIKNACSKASGRRLGSPSQETNMPRCISGWKSVSLKLLFYGTDS